MLVSAASLDDGVDSSEVHHSRLIARRKIAILHTLRRHDKGAVIDSFLHTSALSVMFELRMCQRSY